MNNDKMGGLIKLSDNLEQPRLAKPSDWPAVGPSGPAGEAKGAEQLLKPTVNQDGPRHTQDSGENTPSVWGKDGEFKVEVSKGEGGTASTAVSIKGSVDCETGSMVPPAQDQKY
jgi:hypothetical protein